MATTARTRSGAARTKTTTRRGAPPLEHRMLMTASLCLLAFGAVMVYSASSPPGALTGGGNGTGTLDPLPGLRGARPGRDVRAGAPGP